MTLETGYQKRCWLCCVDLDPDSTTHICPACLAQEAKLAELAKVKPAQKCPWCSTVLVEGKPDGNGKPWYFCDDCGTFVHQSDLDEAAEHAAQHIDWLDELRTIANTRQGLHS